MFEHLKRLKLNFSFSSEFEFDKLNQFSALEELYAHVYFHQPTERTLKLPKLRVLNLSFEAGHQSKLTIDCPVKVLFIHYYHFTEDEDDENLAPQPGLAFAHPDLLEEVILSGMAGRLNFSACKNVRICRDYQYLDPYRSHSEVFAVDHLETFPNLQELHYQCYIYSYDSKEREMEELVNRARGKISGALQKKRQQNLQVKIFFQGIQIEGERFFESLEMKKMSDLPELHFQHYDLLATNLYYYDKIDYSILEKHFDDSLPADLFSKFTCVNTVTATGGVKHLDQFATFLRQCKYLCELEVELDSLDQDFCDQLHVNCFFLKKLVFSDRKKEESSEEDNPGDQGGDLANAVEKKLAISDDPPFKKFNFDFLTKQINLISFSVGEFDMETALRCLQICPSSLYYFSFAYFKGRVSITGLKRNQLYSLGITFYATPKNGPSISLSNSKLSFDELAFDLEYFKKKTSRRLAAQSKN